MSDRISQAVAANPEITLRQILDLLQEGCETLIATEAGRLDSCSAQLEDAVGNLQSAAALVGSGGMETPARERCLLLARRLRRRAGQFDALLSGWAIHLPGWRHSHEAHEYGYTAAGAPSPAPASLRPRGDL